MATKIDPQAIIDQYRAAYVAANDTPIKHVRYDHGWYWIGSTCYRRTEILGLMKELQRRAAARLVP